MKTEPVPNARRRRKLDLVTGNAWRLAVSPVKTARKARRWAMWMRLLYRLRSRDRTPPRPS